MSKFSAAQVLRENEERVERVAAGERLIPVLTAITAVFAALATLFSNHNSVAGLQSRTQAVLFLTKASDSYGNYESKRIKIEINQALVQAGIARDPKTVAKMQDRINTEQTAAQTVLRNAQAAEAISQENLGKAERSMNSYESYEVSATFFEVAIVLLSITALMRRSKVIAYVGVAGVLAGLGFLLSGLLK